MLKIFGYECRRLLRGKAFLGMAAATLWVAVQTLRGTVIWGISNTAPFSPWSFGYYLASLLPFLCGAGLLLLTGFYTKSAQQTQALVQAAPMPPWKYVMSRWGAVALGQGLLSLWVVGMGVVFLMRLFGAVPLEGFGSAAVLTLLPLPVLALGLGTVLGRWGNGPIYLLAVALFLLPGLPTLWEPTGLAFFREYPVTLGVLDPALQIPLSLWLGRGGMVLAGAGMLFSNLVARLEVKK